MELLLYNKWEYVIFPFGGGITLDVEKKKKKVDDNEEELKKRNRQVGGKIKTDREGRIK